MHPTPTSWCLTNHIWYLISLEGKKDLEPHWSRSHAPKSIGKPSQKSGDGNKSGIRFLFNKHRWARWSGVHILLAMSLYQHENAFSSTVQKCKRDHVVNKGLSVCIHSYKKNQTENLDQVEKIDFLLQWECIEFYLKRHDSKAQIYKKCKLDNTNKNVSFIWTHKSTVLLLWFFIILPKRPDLLHFIPVLVFSACNIKRLQERGERYHFFLCCRFRNILWG